MGLSTYYPSKTAENGATDYDENSFLSLPCLSRGLYNQSALSDDDHVEGHRPAAMTH